MDQILSDSLCRMLNENLNDPLHVNSRNSIYIYILKLTVTNLINLSRATRYAPQISDTSDVKI